MLVCDDVKFGKVFRKHSCDFALFKKHTRGKALLKKAKLFPHRKARQNMKTE